MTLLEAERLKENPDYKAFIKQLGDDVDQIKEDMIYQANVDELVKVQIKIQTIRLVAKRLDHVIETLREDVQEANKPASAQ